MQVVSTVIELSGVGIYARPIAIPTTTSAVTSAPTYTTSH